MKKYEVMVPKIRENVVYFIQEKTSKNIKIGKTGNIRNRYLSLVASSALPELSILLLLNGSDGLEWKMHRQFEKHRLHGEWFSPENELLTFIKSKQDKCRLKNFGEDDE